MAALTSTALSVAGVLASDADGSVAASDTIAESQFGSTGVILRVINGSGGSINVTISDPGSTALGNAGTAAVVAVANGAARSFLIPRSAINPATGVATVAFSGTTSVTYELYRV